MNESLLFFVLHSAGTWLDCGTYMVHVLDVILLSIFYSPKEFHLFQGMYKKTVNLWRETQVGSTPRIE